ncbi:40S ribosomal protein S6 [Phytophthora megakarya]|uniref:40S ribosomal protein S6 n=1 Tax=Phytophthora megakarya TaxID=4795 RepID=A0A225WS33_9STRA|nr:40S ribosomal protein S6 [Phytophthora megakarya]
MEFCEVLSLVHTASSVSRMEPQETGVKEEVVDVTSNEFAMFSLYQLMNGWKIYMTELSRFTNSRQHAITSTMERMEALIKQCSCEIGRLQDKMADCELEKENAAEEFVETLQLCRLQVEKEQGVDFLQIYNDTFNKTADVQSKFQAMVETRSWLVHRTRNMELHREVYRALHVVACTAASIPHQREDQQLTTEEQVSNRGSKMLMELDSFGAGLEAVMERSARDHQYSPGSNHTAAEREYLRFARDLEEFWLVYRNWLPHVVMDTATRIFFSLSASVNEGCPIRNAVSRVYTNLREEYPTQ